MGVELHREHVIPVAFLGERLYNPNSQWIVSACKTCNLVAGSSLFFSIPEKASFILQRYRVRYAKILGTPMWTDMELKEVDYILRQAIKETLMAKAIISRRLSYLSTITTFAHDYLRPLWVENMYKEHIKKLKRGRSVKLKVKKAKTLRKKMGL